MSKINPKVKKLYYSIGEVSQMTNLKAYVLRYWETEFSQLKPPFSSSMVNLPSQSCHSPA